MCKKGEQFYGNDCMFTLWRTGIGKSKKVCALRCNIDTRIKKFAIDARNKLIASVTDKAGMLGITPDNCSEAITKGTDFEVYKTAAGTEVTLNKKQCKQRRKLVAKIHEKGFEAVVEEVAYTWFNRICAIRFMEVNDYMYPVRVRVLSSEKDGKNEPDVVTMAPDIDWDFTDKERVEIIDAKMNNRLDDLFRMLFIKQCNLLHEVLPGLFEETEDYTEMLLNISFTNEDDVIRMLIDEKRGIPEEDFNVNTIGEDGQPTGQVEIIGWLYQYYNTELKDDTFAKLKKNVKITKERIPAATQLFTPDWIVRYMVENSVGRIWIEHLRAVDPSTDEKAIAEKFGWKYYLPEAEQEETVNVKLAEIRTTYKDLKPTDITCIDPCMGSGHILIAMFDVLMDIYESAGYDKREAAFDIVENNIHGLDIDQRAYQLAYFAVMMKGRGYNRRFLLGRNAKPEPKVYAIIESDDIEKRHLRFFGTSMPEIERIRAEEQMIYLLYTFVDAREYGSILNVDVCDWKLLDRFVNDLNDNGQITFESMGSEETQKILRKLVKIAKNLASKYDAVVTNPPYMKADNMPLKVANYIVNKNENAKYDLYSIFIYRCYEYLQPNGILGMITMHNFMFAPSFEQMRNDIEWWNWISILHLGSRAFSEISGEVVQTAAYIIRKCSLNGYQTDIVDVTKANSSDKKEECYLKKEEMYKFKMNSIDSIPGKAFGYALPQEILNLYKDGKTLSNYGFTKAGIVTGEDDFFVRYWYEVKIEDITFIPLAILNCKELKCVNWPDIFDFEQISIYAECPKLGNMIRYNRLLTYQSNEKVIIVPPEIEVVNNKAFCSCKKAEIVIIPSGVERVEYEAFDGTSIIHVIIEGQYTQWDAHAQSDSALYVYSKKDSSVMHSVSPFKKYPGLYMKNISCMEPYISDKYDTVWILSKCQNSCDGKSDDEMLVKPYSWEKEIYYKN